MNILLVFPRFRYVSGQPPLGISALYSYLTKKAPGVKITVFDGTFSDHKLKDFEHVLADSAFNAVGFSVMNTMVSEVKALAKITRRFAPASKIIVGGPQATVKPDYFLENDLADIAVIGEGEATFLELLEKDLDPEGVKGTVYKKSGRIVHEDARDKMPDLDSLPIPDRNIFDMKAYFGAWNSLDIFSGNLRGTSVIVSRGCPYQCSFCQPTLQKLFGSHVRKYSPGRVIEELQYLKDKFNINAFMFEDDTFLMDKDWAMMVCDLMMEKRLGLVWCCNVRANLCDYGALKKMKEAGLRKINIGIESATQGLLDDVLKKNITVEQIKKAVDTAKSLGLYIQGYFMIGHPKESDGDIRNTIRFARDLDIDEASFSITTPLPGTSLYESDKYMVEDAHEGCDYYSVSVYDSKYLQVPPKKIRMYKRYAYISFYLKPRRLIKQIMNVFFNNGLKKFIYKLERV